MDEDFRAKMVGCLQAVDDLPTLSVVAFDLERALQDEAYGASEVAFIIEEDISLAANMLRAVNSAYFGTRGTISTIREAVAYLGFREVRKLTTTVAVLNAFQKRGRQLDTDEFWRHCLLVAYSARALAQHTLHQCPLLEDEAYMAGLLHDIGVLILDQYFYEEFEQVEVIRRRNGNSRAESELEVIGVDHGELGAYLLDIWNLPDNIVESVRWHHMSDKAPEEFHVHAQVLEFSDKIGRFVEDGGEAKDAASLLDDVVVPSVGLSEFSMQKIVEEVKDEERRSTALLSIRG